MKGCELCDRTARMYCESDEASLCWVCDAKVHGANFLVARHERILLCRSCQSPTPWKAAGARLGPTVSVCDRCIQRKDVGDDEEEEEEVEGGVGGGDEFEEEEEEEEDEGDNQMVPWSLTPPPPVATSSSSEESSSRICNGFLKRMRENVDRASQDSLPCSSPHPRYPATRPGFPNPAGTTVEDEVTSNSFRPSKKVRLPPIGFPSSGRRPLAKEIPAQQSWVLQSPPSDLNDRSGDRRSV